ncbi:MAG: helix-turn-helix domain-containing protein [Spirochaetales bacterium]|nr:helix-turn-helix domain-containing protein [Spirochaetales bacterium]
MLDNLPFSIIDVHEVPELKTHDSFTIYHVLEGDYLLSEKTEHRYLKKGDMAVVDRFVPHLITSAGGQGFLFCLAGKEDVLEELNVRFGEYSFMIDSVNDDPCYRIKYCEIRDILSAIYSECRNVSPDLNNLKGNFFLLVYKLCENFSVEYTPLKRFYRIQRNDCNSLHLEKSLIYLNQNYTQKNIRDVSDYIGVSHSYLCRMFHSSFGITPTEYLNCLKVEKSVELLMNSGLRIIDIAMEVGFSNSRSFITAFKSLLQISPGEWKKKYCESIQGIACRRISA